jgi:hypothetical protein
MGVLRDGGAAVSSQAGRAAAARVADDSQSSAGWGGTAAPCLLDHASLSFRAAS